MDNIPPPLDQPHTHAARTRIYGSFRSPRPRSASCCSTSATRPTRAGRIPILSDLDVRRAIISALDRQLLVRAVFGSYGEVPYGPVSPILWIRHGAPTAAGAEHRAKHGGCWPRTAGGITTATGCSTATAAAPPHAHYPTPALSAGRCRFWPRSSSARSGIASTCSAWKIAVWNERRSAGQFDIDFSATTQDPSPPASPRAGRAGAGRTWRTTATRRSTR